MQLFVEYHSRVHGAINTSHLATNALTHRHAKGKRRGMVQGRLGDKKDPSERKNNNKPRSIRSFHEFWATCNSTPLVGVTSCPGSPVQHRETKRIIGHSKLPVPHYLQATCHMPHDAWRHGPRRQQATHAKRFAMPGAVLKIGEQV